MISSSNDATNFTHKLLIINTEVSRPCKVFGNNSSADVNLLKTQLFKIVQSGGLLGRLLGPLLKTGLPFMKYVIKPLAKSVLIPLGLTAASVTDAAIQKKIFGSYITTIIISNEEMDDIMKMVKSLEDPDLLIKDVSELTKGAFSGLRQFLATESPLKMMKNAFYFTSKAPFVLQIFKFLS